MIRTLIFRALDVLRPWQDRNFMPATDSTSYDPMLKDDYHNEAILNSLNDENHALSWMEAVEADTTQGRQHIVPKRVGRNWSVGSIGARGALPQAGRSAFKESKIDMRDVYLRVGIDRFTMNRARNNKGAFKQALALEMETAVDDAAFVRNRMTWGYGAGILAKVSGAHASLTTIELKDPGNVTGTVMANRYIQGDANGGMFLAFLDGSTFAIKGTATVTAVNADGTDITVDSAQTLADNDVVVIAQTAAQTSYNKEPEGFLASIDDGTYVATYHNISRTTYPIEKASVFTGVGALSLDAIQQWIDSISIKVGGSIDMFMYEHAVARAYLALLEADRRYATDANLMNPDGGTKRAKKPAGKGGPTYGNIPSLVDRDAPYGMAFGAKKDSFMRLTWPDTGWADEGGGVLKWVDGYDEYTAFWKLFENPHCLQPARNFRAEGITVNQLIVRSY
jgi:hypothetical protein